MPQLMAQTDQTGLSAASGTITLFTTVVAGQYRISWYLKKTAADTVSSTSGPVTITYVDPDNTTVTLTAAGLISAGTVATSNATDSATSTGVLIGIPMLLNCKAASAITIAAAYTSNTPGNMIYNLKAKVELMFST